MIPFFWLAGLLLGSGLVAAGAAVQLLRWRRRVGGNVVVSILGKVVEVDSSALVVQTAAGYQAITVGSAKLASRQTQVGDEIRVEGISTLGSRECLYRQPGLAATVDALWVMPRSWRRRRRVACLASLLLLAGLLLTQWNVLVAGVSYGVVCPLGTRVEVRETEGYGDPVVSAGCRPAAGYDGSVMKLRRGRHAPWTVPLLERCEQRYLRGRLGFERCVIGPEHHPSGEIDETESGGFDAAGLRHGLWRSTCAENGKLMHQQGRYVHGRRAGVWTQMGPEGHRVEITVDEDGIGQSWRAWHANGKPAYRYEGDEWTRWDQQGHLLEHGKSEAPRRARMRGSSSPSHAWFAPRRIRWTLRGAECPFPFDGKPEEVTFAVGRDGSVERADCAGKDQQVTGTLGPREMRFRSLNSRQVIWRAVLPPAPRGGCQGLSDVFATAEVSLLSLRTERVGEPGQTVDAKLRALLEQLPTSVLEALVRCAREQPYRPPDGRFETETKLTRGKRLLILAPRVTRDHPAHEPLTGSTVPLYFDPARFSNCLERSPNEWQLDQAAEGEVSARYTFSIGEGGTWKLPEVPRPGFAYFCAPRLPE